MTVESHVPEPDDEAVAAPRPVSRRAAALTAGTSMARLAATAYWRAASTTVGSGMSIARRALDEAAAGAPPQDIVTAAFDETVDNVRRILGVTELEERVRRTSVARPVERVDHTSRELEMPRDLRSRGEELLARSAELDDGREQHPAFEAILDELAPDEARILRLLWTGGPQPILDVQEVNALGRPVRLLARRVSMLAERAGCRRSEDVGLHLDNLTRLGLVEILDEALEDGDYQLLDAQPQVMAAREKIGVGLRVRSLRQTLALTDLGAALCEACLPPATAAELEATPEPRGARSER
jgi:hypothetical protein